MFFKDKVILLISKDYSSLNLISEKLLEHGFLLSSVHHPGRLANHLKICLKSCLVLLEMESLGPDFFSVLKELKNFGIDKPIIAHTAQLEQLSEIRQAGFHSLLPKPLNPSELLYRISRILEREHVWI